MDKKVWFSRRAIRLHIVILIVVPAFLALCLWQVSRALGGNSLSWAYVFEWPLFAAYAIYMWWRFVHEAPAEEASASDAAATDAAGLDAADTASPPAETPQELEDDAEMAAYNKYLAALAEQDKAAGL